MAILTVTARGQVTLSEAVLRHLGVKPGGEMELKLLPDGRAQLTAVQDNGSFRELHGFLAGKTNGRVLSIEEISDAIAEAGAVAGANEA
ncbi:hypothetical protein [Rhizobium sp. Root483D2]|uniref:AbrB/MazE/SpoVT family DNA-binding domain-containing protein n=1 Tax=Rhizobium sp. Root483D2 TaxID=1736545 RepID=UPI000716212A|nr:hypothetical protein [Rhizobium sp. Root483D2]KQY42644.1 transcriptional regulator [Rhizobium sp. Root483D2]